VGDGGFQKSAQGHKGISAQENRILGKQGSRGLVDWLISEWGVDSACGG
jgi:hypothetical protein